MQPTSEALSWYHDRINTVPNAISETSPTIRFVSESARVQFHGPSGYWRRSSRRSGSRPWRAHPESGRISPGWILLGEPQSQIDDHLSDSWSPLLFLSIRIVPFGLATSCRCQRRMVSGVKSVPTLSSTFRPRILPLTANRLPLIIVEQDSFLAEFSLEQRSRYAGIRSLPAAGD